MLYLLWKWHGGNLICGSVFEKGPSSTDTHGWSHLLLVMSFTHYEDHHVFCYHAWWCSVLYALWWSVPRPFVIMMIITYHLLVDRAVADSVDVLVLFVRSLDHTMAYSEYAVMRIDPPRRLVGSLVQMFAVVSLFFLVFVDTKSELFLVLVYWGSQNNL